MTNSQESMTVLFSERAAEKARNEGFTFTANRTALDAMARVTKSKLPENPLVLVRYSSGLRDWGDKNAQGVATLVDGQIADGLPDGMEEKPNFVIQFTKWTERESKDQFYAALRNHKNPENYGARRAQRHRIESILGGGTLIASSIAVAAVGAASNNEALVYPSLGLSALGGILLAGGIAMTTVDKPKFIFARNLESPLTIER